MHLKSGKVEGFEQYSQFTSLKEFNSHFESWMLDYKHEFTKGELAGLKRLVRFAAKVPGVCNAKIATVLKAINEEYNNNGISRSTFKRMIIKARDFGIFTVYETERKNGSQSSNLYVFNRFPANEPPKEEIMDHHNETIDLLKTKNQKITKRKEETSEMIQPNKCNEKTLELDHTYVSNRVPQPFVQFVKCFFSEAKTIEEYWHMTQIAAYRYNLEKETDQIVDISIQSFKQLIRKLKFTNAIKKPIAYFFGILNKKLDKVFHEELFELGEKANRGMKVMEVHMGGEMITLDW
ncbi:hypothetical protein [Neobacillus ginsengisoli]|uniref:Helix-turn-helix domain-containing protein n=1 Tax=Neobacillus ginsengisoli TaxID=904295 RepID=A0ABT9XXL0_9BACI|nr:hypothetical protein [Neobacillus ginsengisoli]MDQ0200305.1 hypothetical protein [Neobacillus ginsengisoli]